MRKELLLACACAAFALPCRAADLRVLPEYLRPDPFGAIVEPDRAGAVPLARDAALETARAAYVSLHLVVLLPEGGDYRLEVLPFAASTGIATDLYREWFHYLPQDQRYYPDALVPVHGAYSSRIPEPDNRIENQSAQAFWLDLWVPKQTQPGEYRTVAKLTTGKRTVTLPIRLRVLHATVPEEDAVTIDHNSYGTSWFFTQYPELVRRSGTDFASSDAFYGLIHAHHRLFYEHRGTFHQLGYGHAGKVGPEFAPRLEGTGKTRRIADWSAYDRHYGPLLDGSAFASTRRGAKPIPFVYLPINPEWPASQLWWGEPGYEREFVQVVSAMERHFREKGWTRTCFELFFNHKKRYMGFEWDGDETRFVHDYPYFREYARLMKLAVPEATPVRFAFRTDASWTMERQFRELAGVINFWVCGGGMFGWYLDWAPKLQARGDTVWIYGGTPPLTRPLSAMATEVLRPWIYGVTGFVRWQTADPGEDPWFHSGGSSETLVYPGDRFGLGEPLASIRLKVERNIVQDLTLLASLRRDGAVLKAEAARRFNQTSLDDWHAPRPALADGNPEDWNNADIGEATAENPKFRTLDAAAWQRVRDYTLQLAREAQ